jgi:hypothetical protein
VLGCACAAGGVVVVVVTGVVDGFGVTDGCGVGALGVGAAVGFVRLKTPAADSAKNPPPATTTSAARKTAQRRRVTDTRTR